MKNLLCVILSLFVFNTAFAAEPQAKVSKWVMATETNPIDDSKTIYGKLMSNNPTSRGIELVLRCDNKKTSAHIVWGAHPGAYPTDDGKLLMRLDNEKAKAIAWDVSADKTSTSLDQDDSIDFIRALAARRRLVVQADPANMQNRVTAVFDLFGIARVIEQLEKSCEWAQDE